jgi:hypothetical protein
VFSSSPPSPRPGKAARIPGETPEERVARLRRAHDAARNAQVSTVDKVIIVGRDLADKAHRITVMFLMGFSGGWKTRRCTLSKSVDADSLAALCFLFTVFAVYDMVRFNRRRRREFQEQVAQFEPGSLNEARLAYITGTADEEQVAMVEAANRLAEEMGQTLPPLLQRPAEGTLAESAFGGNSEKGAGGQNRPAADAMAVAAAAVEDKTGQVEQAAKKAWWKVW